MYGPLRVTVSLSARSESVTVRVSTIQPAGVDRVLAAGSAQALAARAASRRGPNIAAAGPGSAAAPGARPGAALQPLLVPVTVSARQWSPITRAVTMMSEA